MRETRSYIISRSHHWRISFRKIILAGGTNCGRRFQVVADLTMTSFVSFINCFQPLSKARPPLYPKKSGWCCLRSLPSYYACCPWHVCLSRVLLMCLLKLWKVMGFVFFLQINGRFIGNEQDPIGCNSAAKFWFSCPCF